MISCPVIPGVFNVRSELYFASGGTNLQLLLETVVVSPRHLRHFVTSLRNEKVHELIVFRESL
jgi:hypothetical protein